MDPSQMSDGELEQARRALVDEQDRRRGARQAVQAEQQLREELLAGLDRTDWAEWRQPTAITAYPEGALVTYDGRRWMSLLDANVWTPGVSGWRETPADGGPAPWRQPTGAHDAYRRGDLVTVDDVEWRSTVDANVWPPTDYPAGWEPVNPPAAPDDGSADAEPDDVEDEPGAETDEPELWNGDGTIYEVGDLARYDGRTYRARQAHTAQPGWTPVVVPALWEPVG